MITEYIRDRIPAEGEAFEATCARAAVSPAAAPQCVEYEVTRCADEPEQYVLRIVWTSAADHIAGFRGGPHVLAFFTAIKPYASVIEETRHCVHTAVGGRGGFTPTLYDWLGGAEAGLPADPEFRAPFAGDIAWGTRLAPANSQPGATPNADSPVQSWGWGVTRPYHRPPTQDAG